ncbi:MAG TPA: hypothetical protein PLY72_04780 [Candidatus Obscuribacter sp.]|nr:hypothetical protein [Candidatus Obscuribacter sp.]HNG73747.1 hypothetical protein [Candidatus Obscuribacter sp.]
MNTEAICTQPESLMQFLGLYGPAGLIMLLGLAVIAALFRPALEWLEEALSYLLWQLCGAPVHENMSSAILARCKTRIANLLGDRAMMSDSGLNRAEPYFEQYSQFVDQMTELLKFGTSLHWSGAYKLSFDNSRNILKLVDAFEQLANSRASSSAQEAWLKFNLDALKTITDRSAALNKDLLSIMADGRLV